MTLAVSMDNVGVHKMNFGRRRTKEMIIKMKLRKKK